MISQLNTPYKFVTGNIADFDDADKNKLLWDITVLGTQMLGGSVKNTENKTLLLKLLPDQSQELLSEINKWLPTFAS